MWPMLERYKRTFVGTQAMILAVSALIFVKFHVWQAAFLFFAAMQIGAITGATWAARLKRKIERSQGVLVSR
jgi:hypothetical protein